MRHQVRLILPASLYLCHFMFIHRNLSSLPVFHKAVVTIGTFDGVHAGHRKIIEQLQTEAQHINGETVIITFHPHPRHVVQQGQSPIQILTTLPEKIELLEQLGVDHLVVIPFDETFSNLSAEDYIKDFLVSKFNPHTIIIGYDHKFGKGRLGNYQLLEVKGAEYGFLVKEIPEHLLNEVTISSTRIRQALLHNDVATANKFLSYDYFFEGLVIKGNQLGRTIGYPTANLQIQDGQKLVPGNGVYAVEMVSKQVNGELLVVSGIASGFSSSLNLTPSTANLLKGMMNIGVRPTVDSANNKVIEVNIFNFDQDIYGKTIRVFLKHFLRPEVKFAGLAALKEQLAKDQETAVNMLGANL